MPLLSGVGFLQAQPYSPAQNSVLSQGDWYKIAIPRQGIYKISGRELQAQGLALSEIQPEAIGVFGYGGGMLPQPLEETRYLNLPENAIQLVGTEDGTFGPEDYILFYAQGADKQQFYLEQDGEYAFQYEKNLYADTAYYFLTTTEGSTMRVESQETVSENVSTFEVNYFDNYWVHELDEFHLLQPGSGREWYGERLEAGQPLSFSVPSQRIASQANIHLEVHALGMSYSASSLDIGLNQQNIGTLALDPILNATYTDKGKENHISFEVPAQAYEGATELDLSLNYQGSGAGRLNRLILTFPSHLEFTEPTLFFRSIVSSTHPYSRFRLSSSKAELEVWDISQSEKPVSLSTNHSEGFHSFIAETQGMLQEFAFFDPAEVPEAQVVASINPQNLSDGDAPHLLIVAHPSLVGEAQRLSDFRAQHDQMKVKVVSTEQIYNQFSSGRQDISAIRNYAKYLYDLDAGFAHLLLFGKSSYDYKDRIDNNTNLVPVYQSRNSIHPIYSYPSDDYYGFLEDEEGAWLESYSGDHSMDIGVGRLPVKNVAEARAIVDKLIHYDSDENALGNWRTRLAFLADDGDNDRYQRDSELLTASVYENYTGFNLQKIYLDAYPQERYPNQELAPEVNQAVNDAINNGVLVFNYVGHGSEMRLAEENVLNIGMIRDWDNLDRLPFFVTATCEFGRHDDPLRISGAEELLLNPGGGAVGLVTTARPVFSNTNFRLNQAFYQYVFEQEEGEYLRIGDIFRKTKNEALNGRDNRNFSLLGDPSMKLAYPYYQIEIDSAISLSDGKKIDTLSAMSEVRLYGQVSEPQTHERVTSFRGELTMVLHDKPLSVSTRGNEGTVMQFNETNNVIHRGRANVANGHFMIDFRVPKNIVYQSGPGRIQLYARSYEANMVDAFGGVDTLYIGSSENAVQTDQIGPEISLFLEDSTFRSGDVCSSTPRLLARLWDEQGINLSRQQAGHEIKASLFHQDGTLLSEIILNEFYISDLDNYKAGMISYPLGYLEEGKYVLTLQAWDTFNNTSSTSVDFHVSDSESLNISSFYNAPNPFNASTIFVLDHNRAGEDLWINMQIFDVQGLKVMDYEKEYENSTGRIDLMEWQVGSHGMRALVPGMYIVKLLVRSLEDQEVAEENLKIILTN